MKVKFEKYMISKKDTIKTVLQVFQFASDNSLPTGIAVVVDKDNCVEGVISEGDIRRAFINGKTLDDEISGVYNENPVCVNHQLSYNEILTLIPQKLSERNRKSKKFLGNIILIDDNNKFVKVIAHNELWEQKVASHRHVVVLGLGYVGLTLGLVLADEGIFVTGVDLDIEKISKLNISNRFNNF